MQRLTLYFTTALLLLAGLLGYWWHREYEDRRTDLRRRVQAGAREYSLRVMLDLAMAEPELNLNGDTVMRFNVRELDGRLRGVVPRDTAVTPEALVISMSRFDTARGYRPPLREVDPTFSEANDDMSVELAGRYGVRLQLLNAAARAAHFARADTTMLVQQTIRRRRRLDPDRPTLRIVDYRRGILLTMLPQFAYGLLLFGATGLALWSARRNLRERDRQLREKDALLANLAHELKTPIATAGVALEAIANFGADAERQRDYLRIGRHELTRLDRLADRALATLDTAAGHGLSLSRTPCNLAELLRTAWDRLQLADPLPGARLQLRGTADATLSADVDYLEHLCYNLLDNARKYGPADVTVTAVFSRRDGWLRLRFSDDGPGIPAADRERVFRRFYRVAASARKVRGHGLGLAFVRQIARAHGGTIRLADGPGATFHLELPLT